MIENVDNTIEPQTIISLCTGIRGIERGLERAIGEIRVAAYVEIETFICENLLSGMESGLVDAAPIWTDLKTFPHEHFHGKIHGIIGGYPCQPFSVAGNQKGKDDPRHLWPYIHHIVRSVRPVWCFFENVSGHLSLGFDEVYRSLADLGYRVEAGIFTAEEVGAPHRRERLFILAISNELGNTDHKGFQGQRSEHGLSENIRQYEIIRNGDDIMANTKSFRYGRWSNRNGNDRYGIPFNSKNKQSIFWCEIKGCSGEFSNTFDKGLQGRCECGEDSGEIKPREKGSHGSIRQFYSLSKWPARPNEPQHDWEEPRTIKSGMGCSINGYNFREDLLRAFGNAVVEQTAELAFRELLKKHGK